MAGHPYRALAIAVLVGMMLTVDGSFVTVTSQVFSHRMFVMEGPVCQDRNDIHLGCAYNRKISKKMTTLYDQWCDEGKEDDDEEVMERYCSDEKRKENFDWRVATMRFAPSLYSGDEDPMAMVKGMGNFPAAGFALQYSWKKSRFGSSSSSTIEAQDRWAPKEGEPSLYGLYGVTNEALDPQYKENVEYFQHYPMHPYCARVALRAAIYLNRRMDFSESHAVLSATGSLFGWTESNMWKMKPEDMTSRAVKKKDSGVCWAWANPAQKLQAKLHVHYRTDVDYNIYRDPKVHADAKVILNAYKPILDAMPFLCNFRRSEIEGGVEREVPDLPEYSEKLGSGIGIRDRSDYGELVAMKAEYDEARSGGMGAAAMRESLVMKAGWTCNAKFWDEGPSSNKDDLTCDCVCGIWDPDCGRRETKKKVYCHDPDEDDSFERPQKGKGYLTRHCTLAVTGTDRVHEKAFFPSCSKKQVFDACDADKRFGGCSSFKAPKK